MPIGNSTLFRTRLAPSHPNESKHVFVLYGDSGCCPYRLQGAREACLCKAVTLLLSSELGLQVSDGALQQRHGRFAGLPLLLLGQGRHPQHLDVPTQPCDLLLKVLRELSPAVAGVTHLLQDSADALFMATSVSEASSAAHAHEESVQGFESGVDLSSPVDAMKAMLTLPVSQQQELLFELYSLYYCISDGVLSAHCQGCLALNSLSGTGSAISATSVLQLLQHLSSLPQSYQSLHQPLSPWFGTLVRMQAASVLHNCCSRWWLVCRANGQRSPSRPKLMTVMKSTYLHHSKNLLDQIPQ